MPLSNLSATADPFIPMTNPLSVNYYFDQYKYLKMLESAAMSDRTLLSKIKSEFYQLRDELDSFLNTAGKPNSPAPKSTISCSPPLTPRQLKRQLRASNFRARLNSDSVDPPIPRKPSNLTRKLPPHSKHKCFFQYLDMVDAGIIKIPDSPRYLPSVVPISPPSTSISAAKPSVVIGISSSLPIKSFLPRRPPKSPPPTPLLQSRSIVLPTIHQPTWPSNWPTNYFNVFKIFSCNFFPLKDIFLKNIYHYQIFETKLIHAMTLFQFLIFSITLWSHVRLLFATSIFNVVNCAVLLARNVVTVQFAGSIVQIVQFLIDFFLVLNFTFGFMTLSHLTIQTGWILFGII